MFNEYDPVQDRLGEDLYEEEIELIQQKFVEYLLINNIDPI